MQKAVSALLLASALAIPSFPQASSNPFVGRWNFNITSGERSGAAWIGVSQKPTGLEVWYQPTGGNVYLVKDYKINGNHMSLMLAPAATDHPAVTWELDAANGTLTGVQKRGDKTVPLSGVRAPDLNRSAPKAWTKPEALFNDKDLSGWEPIGDPSKSHWMVKDGMLYNEAHGSNLKTTRKFEDFKVHFEVNCPEHANSGFYLRGRYEIQIELEPLDANPPERRFGSIYGRITPSTELPRKAGEWQVFDATLVGRTVTVVRNGVTIIDHKEIEGITGGALDANEAEPGPFYIQGDHTGGLMFRNITVSVPKP
jgi:hypothetical protein